MAFNRWREARDETRELDLIPIMNLMVTLIPFLMLGAAFYHIGVIPTSLPAKVDQASAPPSDAVITVNLTVGEDGTFAVGATSPNVDAETLAGLGGSLPPTDVGPQFRGLTALLADLKARYPKSDTVLLLPEPGVPYQLIVDTLDAAREQRDAKGNVTAILFPVAVFSKKLELPPDPGPQAAPDAGAAPAPPPAEGGPP